MRRFLFSLIDAWFWIALLIVMLIAAIILRSATKERPRVLRPEEPVQRDPADKDIIK